MKQKRFFSFLVFWIIYGSDRFFEFLKSQDPEEIFVSQEDVFEEGTWIEADWIIWGEMMQGVW